MENKILKMKQIINKYYDELAKLPKPSRGKIGGTYYGATQLFSSVGNHLEIEENCCHVSYGYGCNTYYKDSYILRIGGAYHFSTSEIAKELIDVLGSRYDADSRIGIINDYGTNYSVVGFGVISR